MHYQLTVHLSVRLSCYRQHIRQGIYIYIYIYNHKHTHHFYLPFIDLRWREWLKRQGIGICSRSSSIPARVTWSSRRTRHTTEPPTSWLLACTKVDFFFLNTSWWIQHNVQCILSACVCVWLQWSCFGVDRPNLMHMHKKTLGRKLWTFYSSTSALYPFRPDCSGVTRCFALGNR